MSYKLRCETCPFEAEAASLSEALQLEEQHKRDQDCEHRVTIERQ